MEGSPGSKSVEGDDFIYEDGEKWMRLNCMGRLKNLEVNFKKDGGGRDSYSSKLTSV